MSFAKATLVQTAHLADHAATDAKLAQVTAPVLKGRATSGLGDLENFSPVQVLAMLGVEAGAAAPPYGTGDISPDAITNALLANMAADTLKGRANGAGSGDPQDLTATQVRTILNVEDGAAAPPYGTVDISNDAVTNALLADMVQATVKGRAAGAGTGDPVDLTAAQVKTLLDLQATEVDYSNGTSGLAATTVQAAIDELDDLLDALASAMTFQGDVDAGGSLGPVDFPGGGTAQAGAFYVVVDTDPSGTQFGTANSIIAHTGDKLVARVDNASETDGADWVKLDNTDAVTSVAGKVGSVLIEYFDIESVPEDTLLGRDSAGTGVAGSIGLAGGIEFTGSESIRRSALTGDVTASAGSNSTAIANAVVTNAKLANMAQGLIKGRALAAGTGDPTDLTASQAQAIIHQFLTAKGSVMVASAAGIGVDHPVGADGLVLQASAASTNGLKWGNVNSVVQFGRSGIGSNQNLAMAMAVTDGDYVVPVGWIFKIFALSCHCPATTANTLTFNIHVDDVDSSASFTALTLAASTTDAVDDAEPNSPPFVVDATSARKRVGFRVVSSNGGGASVAANAVIMGLLYKPGA